MKVVVSLGGSLLTKELTYGNFKKYADVVRELHDSGHELIVVCGGGKISRDYQGIAKSLGADKPQLDFVGIMATHLNASTFYSCLGDLGHLVRWEPLSEAEQEVKKYFGKKIIVAGGYDVGTSTDYDAAYFARTVKADLLVNATNVDGVYDKDPKEHPDAKKIPRLGYDKFIEIIKRNEQSPGKYRLFDLRAAELVKKIGLKTIIIDASNSNEIVRAVDGGHSGTEVSFIK